MTNRVANPTCWPSTEAECQARAETDLVFAGVMMHLFGLSPELLRISDRAERILEALGQN